MTSSPTTPGSPHIASRLMRLAETALRVIVFVIVASLGVASLMFTASITIPEMHVPGDVMVVDGVSGNWVEATALPLLGIVILAVCFSVLWLLSRRMRLRTMIWALVVWSLVVQMIWIGALGTHDFGYADSRAIDHLARGYLTGNLDDFHGPAFDKQGEPVSYLALYPFQSGTLIWFIAIYRLFGIGNQLGFQMVSAVLVSVGLAALVYITHRVFTRHDATRWSIILGAVCFPLLLSSSFVYGNAPGLALSLISFALSLAAMGATRLTIPLRTLLAVGAFIAMVLAILVKTTSILFLIPLAIVWIIFAVRQRQWLLVVPVLCLAFLVTQTTSIATSALETRTGADFGQGMPRTAWIAMGLSNYDLIGVPGWWGPDVYKIYRDADGDYAQQEQLASASVLESLERFSQDPPSAVEFFLTKLGSEWLDPSFQSIYYSAIADSYPDSGDLTHILYEGYTSQGVFAVMLDGYQSLIYIAAAGAILVQVRRRSMSGIGELLLLGTFLLGFFVYVLWEAKSVYVLPFFVCLIPFAAAGCSQAAEFIHSRLQTDHGRIRTRRF